MELHPLFPQDADVFGRLHPGGPGVQQPGAGPVGGGHVKIGRAELKVDLQRLGIAGGEGVPVDLIEEVGGCARDGIEGLALYAELG